MSENSGVSEPNRKKPWPACGNCGRPAIVYLGEYPACIDCKYKYDMSQWMAFTQNAAMLNYAAQEMDAVVGFGPRSPQIAIPRAPVPPINYNNQSVTVTGGQVGAINFGNVDEIQVHLQAMTQNGEGGVADALATLTNAVLHANEVDESVKNELLEQLAFITQQASAKPEERKPGAIKAMLSAVKEGAGAITNAAAAWKVVEPLLKGHFGL
jgi:hypothetical protein